MPFKFIKRQEDSLDRKKTENVDKEVDELLDNTIEKYRHFPEDTKKYELKVNDESEEHFNGFIGCFKKLFSLRKRKTDDLIKNNENKVNDDVDLLNSLLDDGRSFSSLIGKTFSLGSGMKVEALDDSGGTERSILLKGSVPIKVSTAEGLKKKTVHVTGKLYSNNKILRDSSVNTTDLSYQQQQEPSSQTLSFISVNSNFNSGSCLSRQVTWHKAETFTQEQYQRLMIARATVENDRYDDKPDKRVEKKMRVEVPVKTITLTKFKTKMIKFSDGTEQRKDCGTERFTLELPKGFYFKLKETGKTDDSPEDEHNQSIRESKSVRGKSSYRNSGVRKSSRVRISEADKNSSDDGISEDVRMNSKVRKSGDTRKSSEDRMISDDGTSDEVRMSSGVRNSSGVRISSGVRKSGDVRKSSGVKKSSDVRKSSGVRKSDDVRKSSGVRMNSDEINGSEDKMNSAVVTNNSVRKSKQSGSSDIKHKSLEKRISSKKFTDKIRKTIALKESDISDDEISGGLPEGNAFTADAFFCIRSINNGYLHKNLINPSNVLKLEESAAIEEIRRAIYRQIYFPFPDDYYYNLPNGYCPLTWIYNSYDKTKSFINQFKVTD